MDHRFFQYIIAIQSFTFTYIQIPLLVSLFREIGNCHHKQDCRAEKNLQREKELEGGRDSKKKKKEIAGERKP